MKNIPECSPEQEPLASADLSSVRCSSKPQSGAPSNNNITHLQITTFESELDTPIGFHVNLPNVSNKIGSRNNLSLADELKELNQQKSSNKKPHSTSKLDGKHKSVTSSSTSDVIMFTDADLDTYGEFTAEDDSHPKSVTGSQESVGVCSVSSQQSRFQSKQGRMSALSNRSRNSSISTKSPKLSARCITPDSLIDSELDECDVTDNFVVKSESADNIVGDAHSDKLMKDLCGGNFENDSGISVSDSQANTDPNSLSYCSNSDDYPPDASSARFDTGPIELPQIYFDHFKNSVNSADPNNPQGDTNPPIFKRLPNFQYEGKCKQKFDKLHEILSYSPWRRQNVNKYGAPISPKKKEKGEALMGETGVGKEDPDESLREELLSPSGWAFADDGVESTDTTPDERPGHCNLGEIMETPGLSNENEDPSTTGEEDHGSDERAHPESGATSPLRDSVSSKPNSPVYAAGVVPGGAAREKHVIEESDEILSVRVTQFQASENDSTNEANESEPSLTNRVRFSDPNFTHRICFLNEDDINQFSDVSDTEIVDETVKSLVNDYQNQQKQMTPLNSTVHSCSQSSRRHVNASSSLHYFGVQESRKVTKRKEDNEFVQQNNRNNNNNNSQTTNRKNSSSSRGGSIASFSTSRSLPLINAKKSAAKIFWKRGRASQEDTVTPVKSEISEEERARSVKLISEFLVRQKELEEEAKFALSQAKNMAKMQVQLETTSNKSLDIVNKVLEVKMPTEESPSPATPVPPPATIAALSNHAASTGPLKEKLKMLSVLDMQPMKERLQKAIAQTNLDLMEALMLKDSLRTQQEDLLAEIEDLTRHAQNQLHELQSLSNSAKLSAVD